MNDLIEKLSDLRSQFNCFNENEREAYHTLSEAIKALSERPEPCEDSVSKEAVLDVLRCCYDTEAITYDNGNEYISYDQALDLVDKLSPVTPKRKTGKWIYPYETTTLVSICSECGAHGRGNFCPKCGADMRQREENE